MNIVNPEIIIIGKRYYRSNVVSNMKRKFETTHSSNYDEDPCDYENDDDDGEKIQFNISQKGDDFYGSLSIPVMFLCFVIGKGGESKKRIELDTQTVITVPRQGAPAGGQQVVVKGKSVGLVNRAMLRVTMLADRGRLKVPFTHFLAISGLKDGSGGCGGGIAERFESFRDSVLHGCVGDRNVEEKYFQRVYKLHVTVAMVTLGDQGELERAEEVCREFRRDNYKNMFTSAIKVHIKGLEIMNDDPSQTRVLYAKIDEGEGRERLQVLADSLVDHLVANRVIMNREYETVNLHMTLMNSSYNRDQDLDMDTGASGNRNEERKTIDCTNILKKYKDWDFGQLTVGEIEMCRRHNVHPGTYYHSAFSLKLSANEEEDYDK